MKFVAIATFVFGSFLLGASGQAVASGTGASACPSGTFKFGVPPKVPGENVEVTITESRNLLMHVIILPNKDTIADTYAIKLRTWPGQPDTINYATAADLAKRKHFCAWKVSAINGDPSRELNGCIGIVGTC